VSPLLFANLSKLTLSETQEGGAIAWPKLVPGFDLCATLRLTKTLEGAVELSRRTLVSLKATIGEVDARPTAGTVMIKVGGDAESAGVNTTAAIAFSATAADVATAFNALSGPTSLKPFTCVERNGSWILRAAAGAQMTLTVVDNDLWPSSRVDIREFTFDEACSYELRLCQVPVAEVTTFNSVVPPVPTVSQVRAGADNSGVLTSEIQKVYVPPENPEGFAFALKKGFKRSDPITNLVVEDVQAAVAKLYDLTAGEELRIFEGDNGFLVEFLGDSWLGLNQDLLEVEVVNEARADTAFRLITATNEMATRMRNVPTNGEVKLPLEITLGLENEQNALLTDTIIFRSDLTFVRPVSMARFSAAAAINWNTPLTRESYQQFSPSQVATGQRHYLISTAIGNGSTTVFNIDHNLGTRYLLCQLQESAADGEFLILGTDYDIEIVTDNRIKITFASAPATSSILGQITSAAHSANFQPHTHDIDDIDGLELRLAALEENVATLQAAIPIGAGAVDEAATSNAMITLGTMPQIFEAFPARKSLATKAEGTSGAAPALAELDLSTLPDDGGILPAVHDAKVETLPLPLPATSASLRGKVFVLGGSTDLILPGGGGRRSTTLRPGDHATCDGRFWYRVIRHSETESTWYPYDFSRELAIFPVTDKDLSLRRRIEFPIGFECAIMTRRGITPAELQRTAIKNTRCQWQVVCEWGTFTSESAAAGVPFTANAASDAITAAIDNVPNGTPVKLSTTGTLPAPFTAATLYYTRDTSGNERKLALTVGGTAINIADTGTGVHTLTPQTASSNLKGIAWHPTPLLAHTFQLTRVASSRAYNVRILRRLVGGVDTIRAEQIIMGNASAAGSAPSSANFVVRWMLGRFDSEDAVVDPRSLIVLSGLNREVITGEIPGKITLKPV
jgi:hypothetical protein